MPTPFLALNYHEGVTPRVRRYVTGTESDQGVTFGALETSAGVGGQSGQRVIRFLGHSTWIASVRDSIYRSTDAGASYTAVFTDGNLGTSPAKAGPYLLYPGGVATLVVLGKQDGSSNWRVFTSTDGVSWTASGATSIADTGGMSIQSITQWRGSLYAQTCSLGSGGLQRTMIWNTTGVSSVTGPTNVGGAATMNAALCVFEDRLFCVDYGVGAGSRALHELVGGAWVTRDAFQGNTAPALAADAKSTLFVDPTANELVAIVQGPGANDWNCQSWNTALVRTDRTSSTAVNTAFGVASSTTRVAVLVDGQKQTGSAPPIYLYHAANGTSGTPFTLYQWNGVSSPITSIGSGGNVQRAMPFGVQNGGNVFWTSGQRHIEIVSRVAVSGGLRYTYRVYSPNGSPDTVSVRLPKATNVGEYPLTPYATLSNPSPGSLSGGTTITGIDAANNGVTPHLVTWEAQTDGFGIGDYAKIVFDMFS